ncbi:MAG: CbiX/SirB N-terminal domain-containing protein [Candidatus Methanomethylophilaceae archaeon]|jgi:sirohydrochlorin cobaltochelatase|nr:CbiX/SirB N-terminal domain-containing protein [Candidatus Methanomethylophilaceae archaeon]NLF33780.1 hypothetical protein [Thermoplasmatales archaeon]
MRKTGTMIIGHGSRFAYNSAVLEMQAELLRGKGIENVYVGYNETSLPRVDDTLGFMAEDGVDEVVAIPFFIASGLHITRDIPAKLGVPPGSRGGKVTVGGREMTVHYETPLGKDPLLTDILDEKIRELGRGGRIGIIVIGHGSKLPHNTDTVSFHAEGLRARGHRDVRVGYNEMDSPSVEETVRGMLEDGVEGIIALPLFISSGAHLVNDVPPKLGLAAHARTGEIEFEGRTVTVDYAGPVGNDPRLADLMAAKAAPYYG